MPLHRTRCEASGVRAGRKGWVAIRAVETTDVRHFVRAESDPIHLLGSVKDEPHESGDTSRYYIVVQQDG